MRQREALRALVRETHLSPDQFVLPLFVRGGKRVRAPIPSMPGQFQFSVDQLAVECERLQDQRVPAVLLFGLSEQKDEKASQAYAKDGLIQQAIRAVKAQAPKLVVITDVCLCAYMSHGHCGVLKTVPASPARRSRQPGRANLEPRTKMEFWIDNDASLELLARTAVSHARAGADMVAPSDMMDGTVGAIRHALNDAGADRLPIMAYAAKFASTFYAPFRDAVASAPRVGDRRSYQMEITNAEEAVREARLDLRQGADIVMVKPALAYLDVIQRVKQALRCPVAAFNVSGEYAMVKAAASRGWLSERPAWFEILIGLRRAGADILITYWAREAVTALRER